ncbi:MAG: FGGY-family carbohydrate kinase [Pseudomonadota bacterium]
MLFCGIDIGTSGIRAVVTNQADQVQAEASMRFGEMARDPQAWLNGTVAVMAQVLQQCSTEISALAIDGTSGTVLAIDGTGQPVGGPMMYDHRVTDAETLSALAALGRSDLAGSAMGRVFHLMRQYPGQRVLHQADWIAGLFTGSFDHTDQNNALKSGFDPEHGRWNEAAEALDLPSVLPRYVREPGAQIGRARGSLARELGLSKAMVHAGTTDGCASFLASGADQVGDGVTVLGSTITLKLLSDTRLEAPESGIYSHTLLGHWLAGGASNSGGRVLAAHFDPDAIVRLSHGQSAAPPTGLDYYPLIEPGERFPTADPDLMPRLTPRPDDDARFLKAMFEGMARIEAQAYARLAELGGPALRRVFTAGGGSINGLWREIRADTLGLAPQAALSTEAAFGTARLARIGFGV